MTFIKFLLNILKLNFSTYDWLCADGSHTCFIYQSIKTYMALIQDPYSLYSAVLSTQAKQKPQRSTWMWYWHSHVTKVFRRNIVQHYVEDNTQYE